MYGEFEQKLCVILVRTFYSMLESYPQIPLSAIMWNYNFYVTTYSNDIRGKEFRCLV